MENMYTITESVTYKIFLLNVVKYFYTWNGLVKIIYIFEIDTFENTEVVQL